MRTHNTVSMNNLQQLLNQLKNTTHRLSKKSRKSKMPRPHSLSTSHSGKRRPGRPRKSLMSHKMSNKMSSKASRSNCGCGRNNSSKMALIRRKPHSRRSVSSIISTNNMNNVHMVSNHVNKRQASRKHHPNQNRTRKTVRSIINKLLSRKNHTRSNNLATMIEKIHTNNQNKSSCKRSKRSHHSSPHMKSHSKVVKSYYTSHNDGMHKVERGRRIEDDSSNPFIRINTLNNGQMKSFQVSRH